jgi:lysozyme
MLPPVVDIETANNPNPDTLSKPAVVAAIKTFYDKVEAFYGMKPIIYTSWSEWAALTGNSDAFNDYPLWIAYYPNTVEPKLPTPWITWSFWQFSPKGRVAGISADVDMDFFLGNFDQLYALAGIEIDLNKMKIISTSV